MDAVSILKSFPEFVKGMFELRGFSPAGMEDAASIRKNYHEYYDFVLYL